MRVLDFRNVQTIAILCNCFANFAEFCMFNNMLACGIRIAQSLGLHDDSAAREDETPLEAETRRRLWWSLVICDWITTQLGPTCLRKEGFNVKVPQPLEGLDSTLAQSADPHLQIQPVQWQVAMVQLCCALYQYESSLPSISDDPSCLDGIMVQADNELADIISRLPAYLSNDELEDASTTERNTNHPWILWQKQSITIILYYFRMVVARVSVKYDRSNSLSARRSLSLCLDSAHCLISAMLDPNRSKSRDSVWYENPVCVSFTALLFIWYVLRSLAVTNS